MTSVINPVVPFWMSLPNGKVVKGQNIVLVGEAYHSSHRFSISLIQSRHSIQPCLFQLEFLFDKCQTVRNSNFPNGIWGPEEFSSLPVTRGRSFCIEIRCMPDHFLIMIDGQFHCTFMHRTCIQQADALGIQGDLKLSTIQFKQQSI